METKGFKCGVCGEWHDGMPMDVGFEFPDHYFSIPEDERAARVSLSAPRNPDFCVIDDKAFYVRGILFLPVPEMGEEFGFGVWGSLSEDNFKLVTRTWGDDTVPDVGPLFSWFSSGIAGYPDTVNLKCRLQLKSDSRPEIELQPTDHPLAVEQREGITLQRISEILHALGVI